RRPMHVLDVGSGLVRAVPEAVQEVLHVGEVLLGAAMFFHFPLAGGRDGPAATIERQRAVGPFKLHAASLTLESAWLRAAAAGVAVSKARILKEDVQGVGRVAVALHVELAADRRDRQRGRNLHAPKDEVVEVDAPVVAQAVAVVPEPAELIVEAVLV